MNWIKLTTALLWVNVLFVSAVLSQTPIPPGLRIGPPGRCPTPPGFTQISNAAEFDTLIRGNLAGKYVLCSDVVIGGAFTKIGSPATPFSGTLNGNGKQIKNFTLSTGSDLGLFSAVSGTIKNLKLSCFTVSGASRVGSLVGELKSTGVVENVSIQSCSSGVNQISGSGITGGLVGTNRGVIRSAEVELNLTGGVIAGNLVGQNFGLIESSTAAGINTAAQQAGGLVGVNQSGGIIRYSSAHVAVGTATTKTAGGLAANNGTAISADATIEECYATGDVQSTGFTNGTSGAWAGGLVGEHWGIIRNSYSSGSVTHNCPACCRHLCWSGGLVGGAQIPSELYTSYSVSPVTSNAGFVPGDNAAGLTPECFFATVENSYFDTQRTIAQGDCGTGLTTSQLQSGGPPDINWLSSIWSFAAGQDPRLQNAE